MRTVLLIDRNADELNQRAPELEQVCVRYYSCVASALEAARVLTPEFLIYSSSLGVLELAELLRLMQVEPSLAESVVLSWIRKKETGHKSKHIETRSASKSALIFAETLEELVLKLTEADSDGRMLIEQTGEFQGELSAISLIEVIQLLYSAQKTGSLVVTTEDTRGEVLLNEGLVIHAVLAEKDNCIEEGESALKKLVRACNSHGRFIFNSCAIHLVPESISKRTDHLLLSIASKLDEDGY